MRLEVKLHNIHRPHEEVVFLTTHFRDAVLDYYENVEGLAKEKKYLTWEWKNCLKKGRSAIKKHLTRKERARVLPELTIEE